MIWNLLLFLTLFLFVFAHGEKSRFLLDVDEKNGDFIVFVDGHVWLEGNEITLQSAGVEYSSAADEFSPRKLRVVETGMATGVDKLGEFEQTSLLLKSSNGLAQMECRFRQYEEVIVFEQHFPVQLNGTSTGDKDAVISGFPTFTADSAAQTAAGLQKGFAHWVSWHYDDKVTTGAAQTEDEGGNQARRLLVAPGFVSPAYGRWGDMAVPNEAGAATLSGGVSGSGVIALFAREAPDLAAVLSPLSGFMAQSHCVRRRSSSRAATSDPNPNTQLAYGIMGLVDSVPEGYSQTTVLTLGGGGCRGINCAMRQWGAHMRRYYGVRDSAASTTRDPTLSLLGYSTDNGMYYYYNTDKNNTDTYQNTLINVHAAEVAGRRIPYRYILLDSWWYYRANNTDTGGGVTDWSPRPEVFPDGIEYLTEQTDWLVQAHNRYWSDEAIYAATNGGSYEFGIDGATHGAVPLSESFWTDLFRGPRESWNLAVYEQDWLNQEFDVYFPAMMEDLSLARQWLMQMAAGARSNNITVQYCMPYVRHLLQSLEVNSRFSYEDSNVVTQARASDDHKPSEDEDQWRVGGQAMLIHALGLRPSKDGFWSSSSQPGNPYGEDSVEESPSLQAAVATLSAGPVQVGDGIGFADRGLIMKSCREDGRLLHPAEPAMPLDAQMLEATFGQDMGPRGEAWYTFAGPAGQQQPTAHYLLVAALEQDWALSLETLQGAIAGRGKEQVDQIPDQYWVLEHSAGPRVVSTLTREQPLRLMACELSNFQLYTLVPALPVQVSSSLVGDTLVALQWSVVGELDKWVGASAARLQSTQANGGRASAEIECVVGETVSVSFISPFGEVVDAICRCDGSAVPASAGNSFDLRSMVASSDGQCV